MLNFGNIKMTCICISFLCCWFITCSLGWPTMSRSNLYDYDDYSQQQQQQQQQQLNPIMMSEKQIFKTPIKHQWYMAQKPSILEYSLENSYNVPEDDLDETIIDNIHEQQQQPETQQQQQDYNTQWSDTDVQSLMNLMEMYENEQLQQQQPTQDDDDDDDDTWGKIIIEKPEIELEELKNLQKHHGGGLVQPPTEKPFILTTTTIHNTPTSPLIIKPTESSKKYYTKSSSSSSSSNANANVLPQYYQNNSPTHHHYQNGQKEIPLLRPPTNNNKSKIIESFPVITQRSLDIEQKPSPYDTLRKYLSIEDALKKEADKRRGHFVSNNSRQKKRSYVTDEDTLTGQLSNLKKSLV